MNDNAGGPAVSSTRLLDGVCCQYCKHFEQNECPVKTASMWSRWGNWCNVYEPNPDEPEAKPFPFTSSASTEARYSVASGALLADEAKGETL